MTLSSEFIVYGCLYLAAIALVAWANCAAYVNLVNHSGSTSDEEFNKAHPDFFDSSLLKPESKRCTKAEGECTFDGDTIGSECEKCHRSRELDFTTTTEDNLMAAGFGFILLGSFAGLIAGAYQLYTKVPMYE